MSGKDVSQDEEMMREALRLARKGMSWTNPNPLVGAIVVKDGAIVACGYHTRVGASHAEVEALRAAKGDLSGSTLYVNLEPCAHHGKTPPCVDAILKAGIRHVVCATLDPNLEVHGKGVRHLRRHGVRVTVGVLRSEARRLNEAFFAFHEHKRPFVTVKFAASLDGKIATRTGDSKWITNERARAYARALREESQAILVGINTVLYDDPHLGVRIKGRRDPLRIILDSTLKIPLKSKVLRDDNILIVTTEQASDRKRRLLARRGIEVLGMGNKIEVRTLMRELYARGVISVLVEGGGSVIGSFADAGLVDKVHVFHAPLLIGGESAKSAVAGHGTSSILGALHLTGVTHQMFGDNMLTSGYVARPRASRKKSE